MKHNIYKCHIEYRRKNLFDIDKIYSKKYLVQMIHKSENEDNEKKF